MRTSKFARAVALLLLLLPLVACEPEAGGGSSNGSKKEWGFFFCDTNVKTPPRTTIIRGTGGRETGIYTSVRSVCDKPPSKHIVRVSLERLIERSGQWVSREDWLGLSGGGTQVCPEIPSKSGRDCNRTWPRCISGKWRTTVEVDWAGSDPQGQPRSDTFKVPNPPVRDIKCPGP